MGMSSLVDKFEKGYEGEATGQVGVIREGLFAVPVSWKVRNFPDGLHGVMFTHAVLILPDRLWTDDQRSTRGNTPLRVQD